MSDDASNGAPTLPPVSGALWYFARGAAANAVLGSLLASARLLAVPRPTGVKAAPAASVLFDLFALTIALMLAHGPWVLVATVALYVTIPLGHRVPAGANRLAFAAACIIVVGIAIATSPMWSDTVRFWVSYFYVGNRGSVVMALAFVSMCGLPLILAEERARVWRWASASPSKSAGDRES